MTTVLLIVGVIGAAGIALFFVRGLEHDVETRVAPGCAGADGQDLAQSTNEVAS